MINLLKHTYLMDAEKVEADLERLWNRYQEIISKPNWEDMNEARAILFLSGDMFCEKIAPEAIERRLHLLSKPMELVKFLSLIDKPTEEIEKLREDRLFVELEKFYHAVKNFKNKFTEGGWYLDEDKFIELYNDYNPDKELKIGERGSF